MEKDTLYIKEHKSCIGKYGISVKAYRKDRKKNVSCMMCADYLEYIGGRQDIRISLFWFGETNRNYNFIF